MANQARTNWPVPFVVQNRNEFPGEHRRRAKRGVDESFRTVVRREDRRSQSKSLERDYRVDLLISYIFNQYLLVLNRNSIPLWVLEKMVKVSSFVKTM